MICIWMGGRDVDMARFDFGMILVNVVNIATFEGNNSLTAHLEGALAWHIEVQRE